MYAPTNAQLVLMSPKLMDWKSQASHAPARARGCARSQFPVKKLEVVMEVELARLRGLIKVDALKQQNEEGSQQRNLLSGSCCSFTAGSDPCWTSAG